MRKIYSIFFMSILTVLCGISASAQTKLFFKANEDDKVTVVETFGSYKYFQLGTEPIEFTVPDQNTTIPFSATSGWAISQIVNATTGTTLFDFSSAPRQSYDAPAAAFITTGGEGSTWEVIATEYVAPSAPKITIKAPKDSYYVSYNYVDLYPDSDEWSFEHNSDYAYSFTIYAKEGFKMKSITDQNGKSYSLSSGTYTSLYFYELPTGDITLTIDMVDLSNVQKENFTISFSEDSQTYKVYLYDSSYQNLYFDDEDKGGKVIEYIPGDSFTLSINGYNYGRIYKIECNSEVVASNTTSYHFTPSNGDQIKVYTESPILPVPVHFSFSEGCSLGVVKSVYGDTSYNQSQWSADDFTVNIGTELRVTFDNTGYDNLSVMVNGEPAELQYGSNLVLNVNDEAGYEIFVSATAKAPNKLTLITNDWEAIYLSEGYGSQEDYVPTGEITEFEISPSVTSLSLKTRAGYAIANVETTGALSYNYGSIYINGDGTIEIEVDNIQASRTKTAVLYIDPETEWSSFSFILGQSDYNRTLQYDLNPYTGEPTLQAGYNLINYSDADVPFVIYAYKADYSSTFAYLDNEVMVNNYGSYPALSSYQQGQAIKVYGTEQSPLELSYEFDDNVALQVVHDHLTTIDNPSTHNVFKGTQVHLYPVASFADKAEETKLSVLVNNEPIEADEDGCYSFVVNDHTSVVAKMVASGIESVESPDASRAVFNLQGIRVADSLENLPAGVYIVAGKKVNVR